MKLRLALIVMLMLWGGVTRGLQTSYAEDGSGSDHHEEAKPADKDGDGKPDEAKPAEAKPADKDHDGKPDDTPAGAAGAGSAEDKDHDGKPDAVGTDKDGDGKPDVAAGPDKFDTADSDGDGVADAKEDNDSDGISDADEKRDSDGDGIPDIEEVTADEDGEYDEEDPALKLLDADGDGVVEADEVADNKEFDAELKELGVAEVIDQDHMPKRPELAELVPTIKIEDFQKLVDVARKVVLGKMKIKAERKQAKKMKTFSLIVVGISGLGVLLLLMPIFLGKKYPGQGGTLFKYSALAALTFIVTVNLFGGVLYGLRTVPGQHSGLTNPSVALAGGTFDTLHDDAEEYLVMGKELFAPTLKEMREHPDKQPVEIILENGQRVLKDAEVFLSIKNMIKKVDWVFGMIPIILTIVTLLLFVLAIRPTLMEIIKMPAQAAAGNAAAGKDIVKKSGMRVIGELKATICTIGVLVVLTLLSATVLGTMVRPALQAFLEYFAKSVNYLMFVEGSSSGLVFMALFAVILFLVMNLATLILSMVFFLGKSQKIFQQRFNEGTPLSTHQRFFKWGVPAVLLVQIFPLIFAFVVAKLLNAINDISGVKDAAEVSWTKTLLMGPLVLVVAFIVLFWAVRGLKSIKFLATYKVKVNAQPSVEAGSPPR